MSPGPPAPPRAPLPPPLPPRPTCSSSSASSSSVSTHRYGKMVERPARAARASLAFSSCSPKLSACTHSARSCFRAFRCGAREQASPPRPPGPRGRLAPFLLCQGGTRPTLALGRQMTGPRQLPATPPLPQTGGVIQPRSSPPAGPPWSAPGPSPRIPRPRWWPSPRPAAAGRGSAASAGAGAASGTTRGRSAGVDRRAVKPRAAGPLPFHNPPHCRPQQGHA